MGIVLSSTTSPRGAEEHRNVRILHPGSMAQRDGAIPEIIIRKLLMFKWPLDPLRFSKENVGCFSNIPGPQKYVK